MKGIRRFALVAAALALVGAATAGPANRNRLPWRVLQQPYRRPSVEGAVVGADPAAAFATGNPLTKQQAASLAKHMEYRCDHPDMKSAPVPSSSSKGKGQAPSPGSVTPNASVLGGDLSAFLYMSSDGNWLDYFTQASGMPYGNKTLTCEIAWNYGAWSYCGQASTTSSYVSTVTNQNPCPPPGNHIEVTAWLDYGGAQYWDTAYLDI